MYFMIIACTWHESECSTTHDASHWQVQGWPLTKIPCLMSMGPMEPWHWRLSLTHFLRELVGSTEKLSFFKHGNVYQLETDPTQSLNYFRLKGSSNGMISQALRWIFFGGVQCSLWFVVKPESKYFSVKSDLVVTADSVFMYVCGVRL